MELSQTMWIRLRLVTVVGFLAGASAAWADPDPVEFVAQWGGPIWATATSGNLALVGVGSSLVILDVSDPSP